MVFSSPLGNLKGFATSRPPLVIFTLCLTAFAITTLSLAYFIRHSDTLPNPDVHVDWNTFLKHLSDYDLCVTSEDLGRSLANVSRPTEDPELGEAYGNVSIAVSASLSLVQQLNNFPHNVTTIVGSLPLTGLGSCVGPPSSDLLNVTVFLPPNASSSDVCVMFVGPRALLPSTRAAPACSPPAAPGPPTARMVGQSRAPEAIGERLEDDWCHEGAVMRMTYRPDPHLSVLLTVRDRSLINLHLVHTSYFLFVMAMTLVCYALIKGKPKQKTILLEKVPLDPRD